MVYYIDIIRLIYTIFNKKMKLLKKIVNYICFTILYFFFISFIILSVTSGVDIYVTGSLYQNEIILSIVQVSNLLLLVWLLFTVFYELYLFFKL